MGHSWAEILVSQSLDTEVITKDLSQRKTAKISDIKLSVLNKKGSLVSPTECYIPVLSH